MVKRMHCYIVLSTKPLSRQLNIHLGFDAVRRAANTFLQYATYLFHNRCAHSHDLLAEHYQLAYLELVELGALGTMIDQHSGQVVNGGWYEHYAEVVERLTEYCLGDVMTALTAMTEQQAVSELRMERLTPDYFVVKATTHYLLPHDPRSY